MKHHQETPVVHPGCNITESHLGRYTEVGEGSHLAHSTLGDYSYCARFCDIANAQIGKFSNIAASVRIGATDHPLDRASLHHFMYRSADYWPDVRHDEVWFEKRKTRVARIGHDTWIGHGAQIKPEVEIGTGAVVASGAVVTKSIAPYTIVAGIPAKPLRQRQPVAIAERLIDLAWWDWSHAELRVALEDFRALPVEEFLEKYQG
jgi:phosphonate metabolism protein (transferase hexapeptide repeat family)